MKSTILVTGATGNVGSEVVKILQKLEVPFRAAIRRYGDEKLLGLRIEDCVLFELYRRPH